MSLPNSPSASAFGKMPKLVLPDFMLAFPFVTALTYAVLGRRIEHPLVALEASGALGMALSIGLVWWERRQGVSFKDLAPLMRRIILGVVIVALVGGVTAFLLDQSVRVAVPTSAPTQLCMGLPSGIYENQDLQEGQFVSDLLAKRLGELEKAAEQLDQRQASAGSIRMQLSRMLPVEDWLTQRVVNLHVKAYRAHEGRVARIAELQHLIETLPPSAKRQVLGELTTLQDKLRPDREIDRLDIAAEANERKVHQLTLQALTFLAAHNYRKLHDVLDAAQKLQSQNSDILRAIDDAEGELPDAPG